MLDGGNSGHWDSGRYSESRVQYHPGSKLWHVFPTGSPDGSTFGGHIDKVSEQICWAVSDDGLNFTQHAHNPMAGVVRAPAIDNSHSLTTPRTEAMAEGHVWLEDGDPLIYVFHTIRWNDNTGGDGFAPAALGGRNWEDLGVEVFSPSTNFSLDVPAITENWELSLAAGESSPCQYDVKHYRYCLPLKAVISASGRAEVLLPSLSFGLEGLCEAPPPKHSRRRHRPCLSVRPTARSVTWQCGSARRVSAGRTTRQTAWATACRATLSTRHVTIAQGSAKRAPRRHNSRHGSKHWR